MLYSLLRNSLLKNGRQKIFFGETERSYSWLLQESEKVAECLSGQKYGIYCKKKQNCMIALLACLQKSKTAVLMCPEYGDSFNESIAEKAELHNYITDCPNGILHVCTADDSIESELEETAFVIHTSGSTGSAKGVMLTQKNVYENIKSTLAYYPIGEESVVLLYRPIYHAATVFGEFFTSVAAGAKIYVEPSSMPLPYLARIISTHGITHMAGTPTFFTELLRAGYREKESAALRILSVGGECMSASAAKKIKEGFAGAKIFHCYGMTEASPRVLYLPPQYFGEQYQCVGTPLDGVEVKLVDANGDQIVPNQAQTKKKTGELFVRGANIMKGYYKNREATEKVLNQGWYATGDCAYINENGFYCVVGRKDALCIRAGINIWLPDIEDALGENPDIDSVYVYQIQGERTAVIAEVQGEQIELQRLWKWCASHLPKPLVPDRIDVIENVAMFGCGKRKGARQYK